MAIKKKVVVEKGHKGRKPGTPGGPCLRLGVIGFEDAAKVCRVSYSMISDWCVKGHLAYYRLPGTNTRRITEDALRATMKKAGMPTKWLDEYIEAKRAALQAREQAKLQVQN